MFEKFRRKLIAALAAGAMAFGVCGVWAQNGFAIAQADVLDFGTEIPSFSIDSNIYGPIYSADSSYGSVELPDDGWNDSSYDSSGDHWVDIPDDPSVTDGVPSITIESKNLSYSDSIYILYAVSFDDFDESQNEVKMLFWDGAQSEYTVDTAQTVKRAQYFTNVRSKECIVFYSDGIAAKEMSDMLYCRAYAVVNGKTIYSDVVKYSVVDYVYEKRGDGSLSWEQECVFNDMLQYGSSAQQLFGYNTDRLANAEYCIVTVENGTVEDGFTWGRYAMNSMATLRANAPAEGERFIGWADEKGNIVSTYTVFNLFVYGKYGNMTYTAKYEAIPEDGGETPASFFSYTSDGNSITITGYHGEPADVVIPATIAGLPVTAIGEMAFSARDSYINSIVIPEGVTTIGNYAFESQELKNVTLPSTLTTIGEMAFSNCWQLTSVIIPGGATIGMSAFSYCSALTNVMIGEGVTSIGDYAFSYCTALPSITIPESVATMGRRVFEGCTNLLIYCKAVSQPKGWNVEWNYSGCPVAWGGSTEFDPYQYTNNGDSITITKYTGIDAEVEIPATIDGLPVTEISKDAFRTNLRVTSVTLPDTVTAVGDNAFYGCTNLASVKLAVGLQTIGAYAFQNCRALTAIDIPNSVTSIGNYAFQNCRVLTAIDIPNSVTSIGDSAFQNCTALTSITIPESVATMGQRVFYSCTNLTIYCKAASRPEGWNVNWNYSNCPVAWGGSTEIALYEYINNGDSITIAKYTGVDTEVEIPATIDGLPVTGIGNEAFRANLKVTSVTLPQTVTAVGDYVFYGCTKLTKVKLAEGLQTIGAYAFQNCTALTAIDIPNSVTSIGMRAFYGCSNLVSVTIGSGLTTISDNAFANCRALIAIEIPNSVTSIGNYAFQGCTSLTTIDIPNSVTSIGMRAFYGCSKLVSVTIGSGLTKIGDYAFASCRALKTIEIPEGVTSIGNYAFQSCTVLTSITIPESVTTMGQRVFDNCTNLTIYCQAASQPEGWNVNWNYSNCPVAWGGGSNPETPTVTDKQKVKEEKAAWVGEETEVWEDVVGEQSMEMPAVQPMVHKDVMIEWVLIEDGGIATLEKGNFSFVNPTEKTVVALQIVFSCGKASETFTFYFTVRPAEEEPEVPDLDKVHVERDHLVINEYVIGETVIVLPLNGMIFNEVSIHWNLLSGGEIAYIKGDRLYINNATEAMMTVVVEAIVTCGAEVLTRSFHITVERLELPDPNDPEAIIDAASKLENGEVLPGGNYTITGVITNVITAWSDVYGNITVEMSVGERIMQCYRLTSGAADASILKIGDIITVTGPIKNYNGIVEFDRGCVLDAVEQVDISDQEKVEAEKNYWVGGGGEVEGAASAELPANGVKYADVAIWWNLVDDGAGIAKLENGVFSVSNPTETTMVILEAVFTCGKAVDSLRLYFTVIPAEEPEQPDDSLVPVAITEKPVEGVAYKLYMYQATTNQDLYFTGNMSGYYFATSEYYQDGVDIYVSYFNDSELHAYFIDTDGVKQYIGVQEVWNNGQWKIHIVFAPETTSSFVWSDEYKTILTTIPCHSDILNEGSEADTTETFFLGTYSRYVTFSAQKISYADSSYIGNLVVMTTNGSYPDEPEVPELTDEQKVAEEKAAWGGGQDEIFSEVEASNANRMEAPEMGLVHGDVSLKWVLIKDGGIAKVEDGYFSIGIPAETTSVVLEVIFTCGDVTDVLRVNFTVIPMEMPDVLDYEYSIDAGTVTITKYTGSEADVIIPEEIGGLPVTAIGEQAFFMNEKITSVVIPDSVKLIGAYAFANCTSLNSVAINETSKLERIGGSAFNGCAALTSFYIPNTVQNTPYVDENTSQEYAIGEGAFGNSGLTSITFAEGGEGELSIGAYAFMDCGGIVGYEYDKAGNAIPIYESMSSITLPNRIAPIYIYDGDSFAWEDGISRITFYSGTILSSITVEEGGQYYGSRDGILYKRAERNGEYVLDELMFVPGKLAGEITIPYTVSMIGYSVVQTDSSNTYITSLKFEETPDGVDPVALKIGSGAFSSVATLTNVEFPERLVEIGDQAFDGTRLTSVSLPASLQVFGKYAFRNNTALTSITFHKDIQIKEIPISAFEGCSNSRLTALEIPASVESIGMKAFYNCPISNLTYAGSSVKTLGDQAFYGFRFTELTLPEGLTTLDGRVFSGMSTLTKIVLPSTLSTLINENSTSQIRFVFDGLSKLAAVEVAEGSPYFQSIDGVLYNKEGTELVYYPKYKNGTAKFTYETPVGLQTIGEYAFYQQTNLTALTLSADLLSVGANAFNGCTYLTSIKFEDRYSPLTLGERAFYGCTRLNGKAVDGRNVFEIPETVVIDGDNVFYNCFKTSVTNLSIVFLGNNMSTRLDNTFYGCTGIVAVENVPSNLVSMHQTFRGCTKLASVTFNNLGGKIESMAGTFQGCTALKGVDLPVVGELTNAVQMSIGGSWKTTSALAGTFENCTNLVAVTMQGCDVMGYSTFKGCTSLTEIVLPDNLTSIGAGSFYGCTSLTEMRIPDGVKAIPEYAFGNCTSLKKIAIPDGVTEIGASALEGCRALEEIPMPTEIATIGARAFYGCSALVEVALNGVQSVGEYAFYGCKSIGKIEIPASVKSVSAYAFAECSAVTEIILADGVEALGDYAFANCSGVTEFVLPGTVTTIGEGVFSGWVVLQSFVVNGGESYVVRDGIVYNTDYTQMVIAPSTVTGEVVIPATVTSLQPSLFANTAITSVVIPDTVKVIPNKAFYNCVNLTSVQMPSKLERIGEMAFAGCTALTEIFIPNTVHSVYEKEYYDDDQWYAYYGYYVTEAYDGIGHGAFYGCTALENVVFEEGGTQRLSIGDFAFYNCTSLKGTLDETTGEYTFVLPSRVRGDAIPANVYVHPNHVGSGQMHTRSEQGIGMYAFANCTSLENVVFAEETDIKMADRLVVLMGAFYNCSSLKSVTFGSTLGNISISVLGAKGTVITATLTAIGDNVFQGCTALTTVNFPTDTTNIYAAQSAFDGLSVDVGSVTLVAGSDGYDYGDGKVDWSNSTLSYFTVDGCTSCTNGCAYYDPHNGVFNPECPWFYE